MFIIILKFLLTSCPWCRSGSSSFLLLFFVLYLVLLVSAQLVRSQNHLILLQCYATQHRALLCGFGTFSNFTPQTYYNIGKRRLSWPKPNYKSLFYFKFIIIYLNSRSWAFKWSHEARLNPISNITFIFNWTYTFYEYGPLIDITTTNVHTMRKTVLRFVWTFSNRIG